MPTKAYPARVAMNMRNCSSKLRAKRKVTFVDAPVVITIKNRQQLRDDIIRYKNTRTVLDATIYTLVVFFLVVFIAMLISYRQPITRTRYWTVLTVVITSAIALLTCSVMRASMH